MGGENGKRRVERVKKDEKKVERMEEFTPKRQEEKPCKKEKGKKRSLCICYDVSMSKFNVQLRGLWDWKRRTGDFFRKAACFHRKKPQTSQAGTCFRVCLAMVVRRTSLVPAPIS